MSYQLNALTNVSRSMYVEGLKFALQYVTNQKNRKKVEDELN